MSTRKQELDPTKPPTPEQEYDLLVRVRDGDLSAEAELVERNLRLVIDVAKRYQSPGTTRDDLIQEGLVGLLKAARKFEPERGHRFSTYAVWWIRQAISRFVKGPTRAIRLPEYIHDRIARVLRAREDLTTGAFVPDESLVAQAVGRETGEVTKLLEYSRETMSLEAPVSGAPHLQVGDSLEAEVRDPDEIIEHRRARAAMVEGLGNLPGRQTWILAHRYGLADGKKRSRPWIGKRLGISAERVRQLEHQALTHLRKAMPPDVSYA